MSRHRLRKLLRRTGQILRLALGILLLPLVVAAEALVHLMAATEARLMEAEEAASARLMEAAARRMVAAEVARQREVVARVRRRAVRVADRPIAEVVAVLLTEARREAEAGVIPALGTGGRGTRGEVS